MSLKFPGVTIEKRGSIIVETTIFLPIFLVALLTLSSLIRLVAVDEGVMHILTDESERLAAGAFLMAENPGDDSEKNISEILSQGELLQEIMIPAGFGANVSQRIAKEHGSRTEGFELKDFQYLYDTEDQEDLIFLEANFRGTIPLPMDFPKGLDLEARLLLRGFTGAGPRQAPLGFEVFGEDRGYSLVYVFPRAGERFHREGCPIIDVCPESRTLTDALRKKYVPCSHCEPGALLNGNQVFCFPKDGSAYHRKSCYQVDRYVKDMTVREAFDKGYTPCHTCGGGLKS